MMDGLLQYLSDLRASGSAAPSGPSYSPAENLTTNSRRGANFVFSEPPPEASDDDCAFISLENILWMEVSENLSGISKPYKGSSREFHKISLSEPTIQNDPKWLNDSERNANLEQCAELLAVSSCWFARLRTCTKTRTIPFNPHLGKSEGKCRHFQQAVDHCSSRPSVCDQEFHLWKLGA